jgi:hypothetical protein
MTYQRSPKPKFDENAEAEAKLGSRAEPSKGEAAQRAANKAPHSQRVAHGGRPASGAKK